MLSKIINTHSINSEVTISVLQYVLLPKIREIWRTLLLLSSYNPPQSNILLSWTPFKFYGLNVVTFFHRYRIFLLYKVLYQSKKFQYRKHKLLECWKKRKENVCMCHVFYFISVFPHFRILLLQNHPESHQRHQKTVPNVPEHDGKQEGKRDDGVDRCRRVKADSKRCMRMELSFF